MSDYIKVIQEIIDKKDASTYLEIGVFWGRCFFSLKAKRKIGVEPQAKVAKFILKIAKILGREKGEIFAVTSDVFFKKYHHLFARRKIEVAFVDGLHTYKQSLRDVKNCLKYLKKDGVIIVHDCNPKTKSEATFGTSMKMVTPIYGLKPWCGDVWKTIIHLRATRRDLKIFVLDIDRGLGIIKKGKPEGRLPLLIKKIEEMTYKDLEEKRRKLLNLKKSQNLSYLLI